MVLLINTNGVEYRTPCNMLSGKKQLVVRKESSCYEQTRLIGKELTFSAATRYYLFEREPALERVLFKFYRTAIIMV